MGVALIKENDETEETFGCNWFAWSELLCLAYDYGWKPAGTRAPVWNLTGDIDHMSDEDPVEGEKAYSGSYFTNAGQLVTGKDAKNICKALEKAIKGLEAELKQENLDSKTKKELEFQLVLARSFFKFCDGESFEIF